jgi:hypothetical protein
MQRHHTISSQDTLSSAVPLQDSDQTLQDCQLTGSRQTGLPALPGNKSKLLETTWVQDHSTPGPAQRCQPQPYLRCTVLAELQSPKHTC